MYSNALREAICDAHGAFLAEDSCFNAAYFAAASRTCVHSA